MIFVPELKIFVSVAVNFHGNVVTALLMGVIMVIPVSGGLCHSHTKCALLPYKGK